VWVGDGLGDAKCKSIVEVILWNLLIYVGMTRDSGSGR